MVDAPHLVSRYPSLITNGKEEIGTWNKTAQLIDFSELGMKTDLIEPIDSRKAIGFRDLFGFGMNCANVKSIQEVSEPWLTVRPNGVVLRRYILFHKQEDCKEFLADIASPFTRRFVKNISGVDYQPRVRFSL